MNSWGAEVRTVERELEYGGGVERDCDLARMENGPVLMQLERT